MFRRNYVYHCNLHFYDNLIKKPRFKYFKYFPVYYFGNSYRIDRLLINYTYLFRHHLLCLQDLLLLRSIFEVGLNRFGIPMLISEVRYHFGNISPYFIYRTQSVVMIKKLFRECMIFWGLINSERSGFVHTSINLYSTSFHRL